MTIKNLTLVILGVLISTCELKAQQGKNVTLQKDTAVINISNQHKLETFFSKKQINQIREYLIAFNSIKNAQDFHYAYQKIDQLSRNLEDSLSAKQEKTENWSLDFKWIDTIVSGVSFSPYEGTSVRIYPKLSVYKRLAESTPEKCDDDFIDIINLIYGEAYLMPKWIKQTSDYGGTSLLGDGTELNILTKIQTVLASSKEFETDLNDIKKSILSDITDGVCYNYTSQKIITEINKILATVKLDETDKKSLKERIETFKKSSEDLNLDCEHKECNCGE